METERARPQNSCEGLDALITSKKTTAEETSDSEPPVIRRTERKKEGVGH